MSLRLLYLFAWVIALGESLSVSAADDGRLDRALRDVGLGKVETALDLIREFANEDRVAAPDAPRVVGRQNLCALAILARQSGTPTRDLRRLCEASVGSSHTRRLDVERLSLLVRNAVGDGPYTQRWAASDALSSEFGEMAVPPLLEKLSPVDPNTAVKAQMVLVSHLEKHPVLPLIESLDTTDSRLLTHVLASLAALKDPRAAGPLKVVASRHTDEQMRTKARSALSAVVTGESKGRTAHDLCMKQAQGYYNAASPRPPSGVALVLWRWSEGRLQAQAVPECLYSLGVAKSFAEWALAENEFSTEASALLARILVAELVISDALLMVDDDSTRVIAEWTRATAPLEIAEMRQEVLSRAVRWSLAENDYIVAAELVRIGLPGTLSSEHPLVDCVRSRSALVRRAAVDGLSAYVDHSLAKQLLREALDDQDTEVRVQARRALDRIRKQQAK